MKYIIFFLKVLLDSIRDSIKTIKYFNLVKINGYSVIVKLFIIKFFYSFSFIRNLKKIKLHSNKSIKPYFANDVLDIDKELIKINKVGFSEIFNLKKNFIEDLKKEILDNRNNIETKKKIDINLFKEQNESLLEYINRLKKNNISRLTGVINIKKSNCLKNILLSKEVLDLVSRYVGSNFLSINSTYFITLPIKTDKNEKYKNAQFFHWDNDFTKFLKLYIYLSDVDESSGPHIFVSGTHKHKKLEHSLARLYSDENIFGSYKNIKIFNGCEGSFFFTDSYGIHKGMTPIKNFRIMLNIHFGINKIKYHKDDILIKI